MLKVGRYIAMLFVLAPPAFASQVTYLAFADNNWQVWLMNDDGSNQKQLTKTPYDKNSVSWYPDGKHLLVNGSQGELVKVDIKSGNEELLNLPIKNFADAVLSYDGKKIAFSFNAADGSDDNNIWVMDTDGQHPLKLTDMAWLQHEPRWGHDNNTLYFLSGHGQQVHDIWKLDIATGNKEQLTIGQLYHFDVCPALDGTLYFSSNRSDNYEIWKTDTVGKDVQLTNDPSFDASPALSPDGLALLFESSRGGRTNLWAMDFATQKVKQITDHKMGSRKPVYFYDNKGGKQ